MPPADSNTPPVPTPQEPKKGFFAKLFGLGKKSSDASAAVPSAHESQTPPPQLDDTQDPASPGAGAMMGDAPVAMPGDAPAAMPAEPVVSDVSVGTTPDVAPVEPVVPETSSVDVTTPVDEAPAASEESGEEDKNSVSGPTPSV